MDNSSKNEVTSTIVKFIGLALAILSISLTAFHLIFTGNNQYIKTLFGHSTPVGELVNTELSSSNIWWSAIALNVAFPIALAAIGSNKPANIVVGIILLIGIFLNGTLGVFGIFEYARTCNLDGHSDNPCHDMRYCCLYYANPVNSCPNAISGACTEAPGNTAMVTATGNNLYWDYGFTYSFVMLWIQILIYGIGIGVAVYGTQSPSELLGLFTGLIKNNVKKGTNRDYYADKGYNSNYKNK